MFTGFISVKIIGLGNFLDQLKFYTLTAFGHLAGADIMLVTFAHLEKSVGHVQGFIQVTAWETELSNYQSMARIYSKLQILDLLQSSKI
jgi:hypothetical protein